MMSVQDWLTLLLLAGLAGAAGQTVRMIVGLKKLSDEAAERRRPVGEMIDLSRLTVSILIGFVAGMLAALATYETGTAVTAEIITGFAAAGYLGTDFIEGVMSRYLPTDKTPAAPSSTPAAIEAQG